MQRRKYALLKQPFELDSLGDVNLTNPVLGDIMYYDGSGWVNAALTAGNNIDITYSLGTLTIDVEPLTSTDISDFNEAVDDRVGSLIVAGNNIDVTYNDALGTFTIDVEGLTSADISDFTEAAQDAVGSMVSTSGTGVDLVYTDATPALAANLDINGLTEDTSPDTAADYLATYDASAGTHKKVLLDNLGLTGGGGVGDNVTHVDAPPAVPDSMDDEFEGTTLASKWTWRNQGSSTATVGAGAVLLANDTTGIDNGSVIEQTVSGSFTVRCKNDAIRVAHGSDARAGMACFVNSSGKGYFFGRYYDTSTSTWRFFVNKMTTAASLSGGLGSTAAGLGGAIFSTGTAIPAYLQIRYDGTTVYFEASIDGVEFTTLFSEASATFLAAAPDRVGLFADRGSTQSKAVFSWFRKIGSGYTPGKFAVNAQLEPSTVNVTPDTHPATANAQDDEFEGTSLDSKWTWRNQGSATAVPENGALILTAPTGATNMRCVEQTVSGNFKVRAKMALNASGQYPNAGLFVLRTANGKAMRIGVTMDSASTYNGPMVNKMDAVGTFNSTPYSLVVPITHNDAWRYVEIEYDGTNVIFRDSRNGVSFITRFSESAATYLGGAPDRVGLYSDANGSGAAAIGIFDFFRRIS